MILGQGLSRYILMASSSAATSSSSTSSSSSKSRLLPHRRAPSNSRRIHLSSRTNRASGIEKSVVESLIGLRRDIPDSYTSAEPELYQIAVKNFDRGSLVPNYVPPLFGTIPAMRAASSFLWHELNLDTRELQIEEHYYQQLVCPLPKRSKIQTIVQLADIVDKGDDAMFIIDTATRNENDVFVTFNQFCYRVRGAGGIGVSRGASSHRRVQYLENPCQEFAPCVWEHFTLSAAQESVFSRLLGEDNPLEARPPQTLSDHDIDDCDDDDNNSNNHNVDFQYLPTKYIGTMGYIAEILLSRFGIPVQRLKGIKVLHGFKDVLPEDCLNLGAWKFNKHLIFFSTFNYTPGRADWIHSGYLTLY